MNFLITVLFLQPRLVDVEKKKLEQPWLFNPQRERIYLSSPENRETPFSSLFVRWDSVFLYFGFLNPEKGNFLIGLGKNGDTTSTHPSFPFTPLFVQPLSSYILIQGDSAIFLHSIQDTLLKENSDSVLPYLSQPQGENALIIKIPQRLLGDDLFTLYFAVVHFKDHKILGTIPETERAYLPTPVFAIMVDPDEDGTWNTDIVPSAVFEVIHKGEKPPDFTQIKTTQRTLKSGEIFKLTFSLERGAYASVQVFNATGQKVAEIMPERWIDAGKLYTVDWDGSSFEENFLPSGRYICTIFVNKRPIIRIPVSILK